MAGFIYADQNGKGFTGVRSIYEFTNPDGQNPKTVCGLAACATLLTYCRFTRAEIETLRKIEKSHPADLAGGRLGTTPSQLAKALKHYGASDQQHVNNTTSLKDRLKSQYPVICLIQNSEGISGLLNGAHWFVVFAYNDAGVFVTNYGGTSHLSWNDFKGKWESPVSYAAENIWFKGIINVSRIRERKPTSVYV